MIHAILPAWQNGPSNLSSTGRMNLRAYCHEPTCRHNQSLDLLKLRDKLGPDAEAMADDLLPKLRCSKCGGRKIGLIYSPETKARMGEVHRNNMNAYQKAKGQ